MSTLLATAIPSIDAEELAYLKAFTSDLSEDQLKLFIAVYNGKRQKTETILICCVLGFVCAAGIQRFITGQIGMGLLYFFTGGLCLVGTIIDTVNHKKIAFEFNQKMAMESMAMTK